MAGQKKGGLGTVSTRPTSSDPLDALFGGVGGSVASPEVKQQPDPSPSVPIAVGQNNIKSEPKKLLPKYFRIERDLVIKLKIYALENDLKEYQVIDLALRKLFADEKA